MVISLNLSQQKLRDSNAVSRLLLQGTSKQMVNQHAGFLVGVTEENFATGEVSPTSTQRTAGKNTGEVQREQETGSWGGKARKGMMKKRSINAQYVA